MNCENHYGTYLLLKSMRQQLEVTVVNGIEAEWALANAKNDALVEQVAAAGLTAAGRAEYFNNHAAALKAFKGRKTSGMNLSKRVWNLTQQYKTELEMGLDIGIREGLSAQEMSRQMKQYLKYPDKLFRRVRDKHGVLQLSKAAAAFHPGRGVYRSSHMNALRLTGTETNMAYRTADHERIQDLDFVVGIRVVMSNNHTIKGPKGLPIPLTDICDELSAPMGSTATKGRGCYPKGFKFTGWHPNCRCHTETILLSAAEMDKRHQLLRRGKVYDAKRAKNYVGETPDGFNQWVERNAARIAKEWEAVSNKDPYFIRDNKRTAANTIINMDDRKVFMLVTHTSSFGKVLTDTKRIAEAQVGRNELKKFKKEKRMCNVIADNGHDVKYLRGTNRPKGQTYDILIDEVKADLKCISGGTKNIVKYAKKALREQGADAVVFEIPNHGTEFYKAIGEARRKCNGRIFFYVAGEDILKELKK